LPNAAGAISGATSFCPNSTQVYSIAAVPFATSYTWSYSGSGATFTASTLTPSVSINFSSAATAGNLTVVPVNTCGNGSSASLSISLTVTTPTTITYPANICTTTTGTISATITGTAGGTFTSSPAGLTITGAGVITPSTSTQGSYTITYTYTSNGCSLFATRAITVTIGPVVNVTATPASICSGGSSQLQATANLSNLNYTVSSIPYAAFTPAASATNVYNAYTDDGISAAITIPFTFNFYGALVNQFFVSTNGHIQLQTGGVTAAITGQILPNPTDPDNVIALAWCDLVVDPGTNAGANIRYFVNGTAPNRVMVVEYTNLRFLGGTSQNVTGQIRMYELDNHIEVAVNTVNDNGSLISKTLGIENATGSLGITPTNRNYTTWNVNNEAWAF
jgi:hypothetical protein